MDNIKVTLTDSGIVIGDAPTMDAPLERKENGVKVTFAGLRWQLDFDQLLEMHPDVVKRATMLGLHTKVFKNDGNALLQEIRAGHLSGDAKKAYDDSMTKRTFLQKNVVRKQTPEQQAADEAAALDQLVESLRTTLATGKIRIAESGGSDKAGIVGHGVTPEAMDAILGMPAYAGKSIAPHAVSAKALLKALDDETLSADEVNARGNAIVQQLNALAE